MITAFEIGILPGEQEDDALIGFSPRIVQDGLDAEIILQLSDKFLGSGICIGGIERWLAKSHLVKAINVHPFNAQVEQTLRTLCEDMPVGNCNDGIEVTDLRRFGLEQKGQYICVE